MHLLASAHGLPCRTPLGRRYPQRGGHPSASPILEDWFVTDTDFDTLATALYVTLDDALASHPEVCPLRPASGFQPKITGAYQPTTGHHTLLADKGYASRELEQSFHHKGIHLLRPPRRGEPQQPGIRYFKPLRQIIESVNATLKTHLDTEHHRGRTPLGLVVRITAALLALTTAIWHNKQCNTSTPRSLIPYDH